MSKHLTVRETGNRRIAVKEKYYTNELTKCWSFSSACEAQQNQNTWRTTADARYRTRSSQGRAYPLDELLGLAPNRKEAFGKIKEINERHKTAIFVGRTKIPSAYRQACVDMGAVVAEGKPHDIIQSGILEKCSSVRLS